MLDLTRRLDDAIEIYAAPGGGYRDPPFACAPWASIEEHGFRVSALRMGTQTGTHIDAPSHFEIGAANLDALALDALVGRYALIDLPSEAIDLADYRDERLLFVRAPDDGHALINPHTLAALLALPPIVWVVAGAVEVRGAPPLELHRALARAGKYLVEDLDPIAARAVVPGGELIVMPLALIGTSGSPCRVVVR
jgi:kynurenine formamidase